MSTGIDWSAFWHMGGYAAEVFGSYGFALALLLAEGLWLWRRHGRPRHGAPGRVPR